jgi:hypothetical protein
MTEHFRREMHAPPCVILNRFARRLANERKLELWKAARLFALMNAALVDTYVAVWDSKYEFNHWRPYTAIRQAANDGNSWTQPDLQWESLRPAPPFPEYVSAHAAGCACTFAILAREFGRNMSLTLDSLTAPPGMPTRSFKSSVRRRTSARIHAYAWDSISGTQPTPARRSAGAPQTMRWSTISGEPGNEGSN